MRELTTGQVLAQVEDGTALLTLNRPEVRNAIDLPTRRLLLALLEEADADEDIRVVILTGTDPAFCGGVDFKALAATLASGPPPGPNPGQALRAMRTPVIAAVNGACVTGGLELALSCDIVVASERAVFADTHARRGLSPGRGMWGMTALLPGAVGVQRAKELSLTGRLVPASEAVQIGLVGRVVEHDTLKAAALETAKAISSCPSDVVSAWLDIYDRGAGCSLAQRLQIESDSTPLPVPERQRDR